MKDNKEEYNYSFSFKSDFMISTNDMYIHKVKKNKKGRLTCFTTKSNGLRDFQSIIGDKLTELISDDFINNIKSILSDRRYGLSIHTIYNMPLHNYEDSDVSNYIKAYEDCISTRMKGSTRKNHILDDKNNLEYHSIKKFIGEGIDHWFIETNISVIERDSNYINYLMRKGVFNDSK